jgi:tetratricopeptide (TPR) repeat protein
MKLRRFWDVYRTATRQRVAGDLGPAIRGYREALALRPDHEDSLYYLGNCCLERRRYAEALSAYQRLVDSSPQASSRGYIQLGLVYACLDPREPGGVAPTFDLDKAERSLRLSRQMDAENGALLGLGEVALLRGDRRRAWELVRSAHADNPSHAAAPYLLGYLAWRDHESAEAWRWFQRALQCCKVKKLPVKWTQEGDLKANPELRWRALERQSILGRHWIRLRRYLGSPQLSPATMEREYRALHTVLTTVQAHSRQSRVRR